MIQIPFDIDIKLSFEEEDDRYRLPWHCKCSAHLLNLLARKDSEMDIKR
jgi:hypothetical protein